MRLGFPVAKIMAMWSALWPDRGAFRRAERPKNAKMASTIFVFC